MAPQMTIGRLAKASDVKVTTIRYYESIGLMGIPARSTSGQRLYGEASVQQLSFIRHARELGFPIDDIRELIEMQTQPSLDCAEVDEMARRQLADVQRRLAQLKTLEAELERMVAACAGGNVGTCEVLATLADHELCISEAHEKSRALS